MSVGKGSLVRASKANAGKTENVEPAEEKVQVQNEKKAENIQEAKFQLISNIKSDLPVHLL